MIETIWRLLHEKVQRARWSSVLTLAMSAAQVRRTPDQVLADSDERTIMQRAIDALEQQVQ